MRKRLAVAFLFITPGLFGQLDSNSVTVTASSNATLQPDQATFAIQVASPLNTTLDEVVGALQGSGVTAANFTGITPQASILVPGQTPLAPVIIWDFTLSAPFSKIKDTVAQLTTLQQSIAKQNRGLSLIFNVQGAQISQRLQQSQPCVLADLIAKARVQAQNLASAAGFTLDVIQAMSSTVATSVSGPGQGSSVSPLGAAAAPCTVTVKYGLIRN